MSIPQNDNFRKGDNPQFDPQEVFEEEVDLEGDLAAPISPQKALYGANPLTLVLILVLVATGSFGLGRLSRLASQKEPIRIENVPLATSSSPNKGNIGGGVPSVGQLANVGSTKGNFVASQNGSKYYLSWCSGAARISEANKIYFNTKEAAEKAGYTPSATCKGL